MIGIRRARTIAPWLVALLGLAGCAQSSKALLPDGCDVETAAGNRAVIEEWIDNIAEGDVAGNQALASPEMTVTTPDALPYGGTLANDDYGSVLIETWQPDPATDADPPELLADCEQVVLIGTFTARSAETGQLVEAPLVEVFTIEDGMVVNDTIYYFDTTELLDALETGNG